MTAAQVTALVSAVSYTEIIVGIAAIAATIAGVLVTIRGARMILGMIGSK